MYALIFVNILQPVKFICVIQVCYSKFCIENSVYGTNGSFTEGDTKEHMHITVQINIWKSILTHLGFTKYNAINIGHLYIQKHISDKKDINRMNFP